MREGWEIITFGDIMTPAKIERCGDRTDLPILSITMRNGIIFQNERFKKVIASSNTKDYKIVNNGQLVIAFPIDEGLIYTQDIAEQGIMSPAYNIWDVDYSKHGRRFLGYYFHCPFAMNYYKSKLRGTTQRRRMLPKEVLLSFPIPVPPLSEQQRIVNELDVLSSIIEKKKAQLKEYDQLAQSIFYDMFGDPIENPKGWEMNTVGELSFEMRYGTSRPACEDGKYNYLRMGNLTNEGYLNLDDLKKINVPDNEIEKCIVRRGDVLFNRTNSLELIGKTCLFDLDEPMVIAGYLIRVRFKESILPLYFTRLFNLSEIKKKLRSMAKGAVHQANINAKELASIIIPVPPLSLQQSFASKIEALERQKALIQQSITEVETLFNSRMDYWFS